MKISVDLPNEDKAKAAIKKVKGKKPLLTMEEAWAKIFSMKNSAKDKERLNLVKEYLEEGKVSREEDKLNKNFSKAEALRIYQKVQEMEREALLESIRNKDLSLYPLINDRFTLIEWVNKAVSCDDEYLAMDFETVGDNGGTNKYAEDISGFSLTYRYKGEVINGYVPMRHREEGGSPSPLNIENVEWAEEAIRKVFASDKATVWHNATFDLGLANASLQIVPNINVHDTLIIMHLLDEDLKSYKLKDLVTRYLNMPSSTFEEMFGKNAKFADVDVMIARWYGAKDTHVGFLLFEWQLNILNKPSFAKIKKVYERIERPCIMATFEMESEGFHINMEEVEVQRKESEAELEEISARLQARFGDVNFSSPSQLLKLLYVDNDWSKYVTPDHKSILRGHVGYDKHGISNNKLFALMPNGSVILDPMVNAEGKVVPKNDRNKLQANAKAMKKIAKAVDEVQDILDYKDLTKHLTAFVNKIDTFIAPDGKLHGQFNQFGTVTGRFSASNPNLQQQPKKARKMFEAPEGSLILGADFSQQEPRLLAHSSGCQELINIYNEGRDLYSEMASAIFNKPIEECLDGSIYRKNTKMIVLAIMYGMGAYSLADILRIDAQEAQKMIDDFFVVYPEVETWIEGNKKTVVKQRYVETLFGMRRRFKHENFDILKKNWNSLDENDKKLRSTAARALRQATNALIQGGAASQTKLVMNAARIRLKELSEARGEPNSFGFLAQIHDECLFKVPEDVTQEEVNAIEDVMINTVKLAVPSKTDIEIGKNWGKMVSRKEWFND
ncbi:DNA polymerase [Enterococcus phage BC611]|uniref:DNA polymerase I n=1 Tax=Enterococcus phage BC611 TaxID=1173135 RepID=I4DSM2_9CAUD|nr:DNA polymerase [Enterococcus phage BC611]BAM20912.1 DNA polymerase I [Enterococcus phage BC611]